MVLTLSRRKPRSRTIEDPTRWNIRRLFEEVRRIFGFIPRVVEKRAKRCIPERISSKTSHRSGQPATITLNDCMKEAYFVIDRSLALRLAEGKYTTESPNKMETQSSKTKPSSFSGLKPNAKLNEQGRTRQVTDKGSYTQKV